MYENTNSSIDWKGIFLKVIIAFLVIAIALTGIKTFTKGKEDKKAATTNIAESNSSTTFTANMEKLKEAGKKYYKDNTDKLPQAGITSMVTLNDLIKAGLITSLTDVDGKACDGESSYVTAEKSTDPSKENDYAIKANLVCGESYNFVTTYLGENAPKVEIKQEVKKEEKVETIANSGNGSNNCGSNCTPTYSSKTEVENKVVFNTGNTTTTDNIVENRQFIVSFDGNGGTCNYNSYYVNEGEYVNNPGICKRSGYNFIGWYLDGIAYNFNTPVTRDIRLVAQYTRDNGYYLVDDDDDNYYDNTDTDTVETYVYSMGWDKSNIYSLTINHVLDVEPALEEIENNTNLDRSDITKIRISKIRYSEAIDTSSEAKTFRRQHAYTFLNSASARVDESDTNSSSSLGYIRSAEFEYDNDFVSLSSARRNGFDVTWYTNRISRTCSSPFTLNLGYNNVAYDLCNYGIIYEVTWEYKYSY